MIEKLPDVPFRLIFGFLSYGDRFSLRRTCKRLKSLVDGQVSRNLFIFYDCYPSHQYLFESNELVYYSDSCRVLYFSRFISNRHERILNGIRKLTIYFESLYPLSVYRKRFRFEDLDQEHFFDMTCPLDINLEHLDSFEMVEHLEIKVTRLFRSIAIPLR